MVMVTCSCQESRYRLMIAEVGALKGCVRVGDKEKKPAHTCLTRTHRCGFLAGGKIPTHTRTHSNPYP